MVMVIREGLKMEDFFAFDPGYVCFSLSVFVFVCRMELRIEEEFP